jgi:hypothetical protein
VRLATLIHANRDGGKASLEFTEMSANVDDRAELPERIGQRYRVVRELGRGGMASVYEVLEEATGKRLAVKQLHAHRTAEDEHLVRLFELEFHTLTQLAHPRVVAVYDYQKHNDGASYSMELLDGGDLREHQPLAWKLVCALLCDVCSALSLLHSRRLLHRDVTPRNIRLTRDGKAKLIDFGAMVPFGTHKHPVGTPAFTAPEAVYGQPLDGRADLFSIGATAYFALTGHHAYPSRSFAGIRNAWRTQPALPSSYVKDIPPALDQLVMSLLSLPVTRRPASAAAVIERLTAIADLRVEEQLLVQRSFLSTPMLVGRDAAMQQIRRQMIQASRGRGSALFLTGPHGVGRSRMVDACALEAKLASATLLRADANDASDGEWGGVRSLLDQLLIEQPAKAAELITPHARQLAQVWPRALELCGLAAEPAAETQVVRAAVHGALLKLMEAISHQGLLVLTADDLDRVDEPTRAFIALLVQRVSGRRVLVVTAAASEDVAAGFRGLGLMRHEGSTLVLQPLSLAESERLVISIFGEVPNVRLLVNRLYDVSNGSPATTMQLCQYLLDRDIVRFRDGSWLLPNALDRAALPSSLTDALRARLALLDGPTRELGQAMALSVQPSLTLDECQQLMAEQDPAATLRALDALIATDVVRPLGVHYALSQPAWVSLLRSELDPTRERVLQARLAAMLLQGPDSAFRAAGHLLACGRELEAIELVLSRLAEATKKLDDDPASLPEHLRQLPANWPQTLDLTLQAAVRLNLPRRKRLTVQLLLLGRLATSTTPRFDIARDVVDQLYSDTGLRDYAELAAVPAPDRLGQAYARAQARYDATPEHDRGLPPSEAIPALVRLYVVVIAMVGAPAELAFLRSLPSLEPFFPLSPAISLVQCNVEATCHMFAGRIEQAHAGYLQLLEALNTSNGAGMVQANQRYVKLAVTYALAVLEIMGGRASAAERVSILEADPLFEVNASRLRTNWALRQGDTETADRHARKTELLKIRNAPTQFFEGSEAWYEAVVFAELGDVARMRWTLERLDRMGEKFPTWTAAPLFARAQIQLLRGEAAGAAETFEAALARCAAGGSVAWVSIARGLLEALAEAGRVDEARRRGAALLREAHAADLSVGVIQLHLALAKVELAGLDCTAALAQLQAVEEIRESWPIGDTFAGKCHELRARVAIAMGDAPGFDRAARSCMQDFSRGGNAIMIDRYQRLLQDAERAGLRATSGSLRVRNDVDDAALPTERERKSPLRIELASCEGFEARTAHVVSLVAEEASAHHVLLYLVRDKQPALVAATEHCPVSPRMAALVSEFLADELEQSRAPAIDPDDVVTTTVDNSAWTGPTGVQFVPALLSHRVGSQLALTGVLVFDIDGHTQPSDELLSGLSEALTATRDVEPLLVEAASA